MKREPKALTGLQADLNGAESGSHGSAVTAAFRYAYSCRDEVLSRFRSCVP